MRRLQTISLSEATKLLDFNGKGISRKMADEQLEGSVAAHNLLAKRRFAYLADEVGMGKTYVALGVVGLLRFFNPGFRVLYIAPRENIQRKWIKELRNFVANNWRGIDQRVKAIQGTPARGIASCGSLFDWTRKAVRDPNRDFFCRLTSFSFGLGADPAEWRPKRDELRDVTPLRYRRLLDLRHKDKARFKAAYARTLNLLHPHYDLVILDEAHNLKHGRSSQATRNQLIQLILGTATDEESLALPDYGQRFDRLLLLSATPIETDYTQLWNQLDLFGFGSSVAKLRDEQLSEEEQHEAAGSFMIRRLAELDIGGEPHTKNMYRREWRAGGCEMHDQPLSVPDERQRLIVALVQKKVAEVLSHEKFNNNFQVGMLASFESFLETAAVAQGDDDQGTFEEGAEQTREQLEREGIDTPAVNQLARSYRRKFGEPLPHPKMDGVVASLAESFRTGSKSLVFVRRIKSVEEIAEKLCVEYDKWLLAYLRRRLRRGLRKGLTELANAYHKEQERRRERIFAPEEAAPLTDFDADQELLEEIGEAPDEGGFDTFFSWFFRGEGPAGWNSGAAFRRNRLGGEGSLYSTFFQDNYVADLLGARPDVLGALSQELGQPAREVAEELRFLAFARLRQSLRQKQARLKVFHAFQEAALELLSESASPLCDEAQAIRQLRYGGKPLRRPNSVREDIPEPEEYLDTRTFFTELRERPDLQERLWPYPEAGSGRSFAEAFRRREQRRELLSATARLGHAYIDLWVLAVNDIGSLRLRSGRRNEDRVSELIEGYLDLLEGQSSSRAAFDAFTELELVAQQHDLIHAVNFPEARQADIASLPRLYATTLGKQTPVGRMHGGAKSDVLVRQFRLPGYPFSLITTDVLREGEDLHTFCSRVIHYGLAWTPSATEQRTGRVDRIGSLTHRELDSQAEKAEGDQLLQVFYPYLEDTVERIQAIRVFERMNRFVRLIHSGFRSEEFTPTIDARNAFAQLLETVKPIGERLKTRFPVRSELLKGRRRLSRRPFERVATFERHFQYLVDELSKELYVSWDSTHDRGAHYGTVNLVDSEVVSATTAGDPAAEEGVRQQPFVLALRKSAHGDFTLLHGISPIGPVGMTDDVARRMLDLQLEFGLAKICAIPEESLESYSATVEGGLLLDPKLTQVEELVHLVTRICVAADHLEKALRPGADVPLDQFRSDMRQEAQRARH